MFQILYWEIQRSLWRKSPHVALAFARFYLIELSGPDQDSGSLEHPAVPLFIFLEFELSLESYWRIADH